MNGKKVIITGGAGFIGSNLAEILAETNEVTVFDNLSTGNKANIQNLDVNFIEGSIIDIGLLKSEFAGIDYVFHLAALPSVPRSINDPILVNQVNITGTLNVLVATRDAGVKKVVFAASSSAYGDTPTLPKVETMPPNPLSPYAITKLAGEYYCKVFYQIYGLPTAAVRYFNVYGPRQNPNSEYAAVIPKFIKALNENRPPIIYGDGEQTRDFTFVKDAAMGTIKAAEAPESNGKVTNLAGGQRISLNKLTETLKAKMGKQDILPIYEKSRDGDVKHSLADISLAKSFGYAPKHDIDSGLEQTISYFMKVL